MVLEVDHGKSYLCFVIGVSLAFECFVTVGRTNFSIPMLLQCREISPINFAGLSLTYTVKEQEFPPLGEHMLYHIRAILFQEVVLFSSDV